MTGSNMQPYLGKPSETRKILRKYDLSAKKKYGQNFLVDPGVLEGILDAAQVNADDFVIEIGPGIGTLTQYLAASAGRVCAVEIDRALLPVLDETLAGFDNVEVLSADILKTDIRRIAMEQNGGKPVKIVANLPYYITTPIILGIFESRSPITSMTVMVQKEVADRMEAGPGSKKYGALSLAVQYFSRPEVNFIVHPGSFIPQPGVDSAVVTLHCYEEPPVKAADEKALFALIRASFSQRRKKLSNGIANDPGLPYSRAQAEEALRSLGLPADIRGEKLSLQQFASLADQLQKNNGS